MEEIDYPGKAVLASRVVWAFWGFCTALLITLSDGYSTHHFESPLRILFHFVLFVVIGVLLGPVLAKYGRWHERTRTGATLRVILFAVLMVLLAYILWRMATGR
jgi:hypothetical protein